MFELSGYTDDLKNSWDQFVKSSKNGTFLFLRDYIDYHSDRFNDYSVIIYKNGKIVAALPGNLCGEKYFSHQGLTYGGLILSENLGVRNVLSIFNLINAHLKKHSIREVIYKPVPYIYHQLPSQEDIYCLFKLGAVKSGCHISSAICNSARLPFKKSRKSGIKKSNNGDVKIYLSDYFEEFWDLLTHNLQKIYKTNPVHSLKEILYLKSVFPGNIKLHLAEYKGRIVAGAVIYLTDRVAHVQYISADDTGRKIGALDLLFNELINVVYVYLPFFDLGSSTEQLGNYLNTGLVFQKEGFGGRGVVYETYQYSL